VQNWPAVCEPVDQLPSKYLRQLYFDSLVYSTENLRHLINTVGADRLVIGTDFPFNMGNADAVNHLLSVPDLTAEDQEAILGATAAGLLGIT
jgi:aminocarboxymuconate-semialdehyde decarboxylase